MHEDAQILAAGMKHDVDLQGGKQLPEGSQIRKGNRVDKGDSSTVVPLDQTQASIETASAHELRVEAQEWRGPPCVAQAQEIGYLRH